jgi:hypothetical protein
MRLINSLDKVVHCANLPAVRHLAPYRLSRCMQMGAFCILGQNSVEDVRSLETTLCPLGVQEMLISIKERQDSQCQLEKECHIDSEEC